LKFKLQLILGDEDEAGLEDVKGAEDTELEVEVQCGACKLIQQIEGMTEHECEEKMKEIADNESKNE